MKRISKLDELKNLKERINQLVGEGKELIESLRQNEVARRQFEIAESKFEYITRTIPYLNSHGDWSYYRITINNLEKFNVEQKAIDLIFRIETHLKNIEIEKEDLCRDFENLKKRYDELKATEKINLPDLQALVKEMEELHKKTVVKIIKIVSNFMQSASAIMQETPVLFSEEKEDVHKYYKENEEIAASFTKGKLGPQDLEKHLAVLKERKEKALQAQENSKQLGKEQLRKEARAEAEEQARVRAQAAKSAAVTPNKPGLLTRMMGSLWQSPPQPEAEKQPVTMHIPSTKNGTINPG